MDMRLHNFRLVAACTVKRRYFSYSGTAKCLIFIKELFDYFMAKLQSSLHSMTNV